MVLDKRTVASALVALVLATLAPGVMAHEKTAFDENDSPGPLDLVAARQRHRVWHELQSHPEREYTVTELSYRLATYEEWEREILSGGRNFISLEFNLDDDQAIERCLVITNSEFEMLGHMYKNCTYYEDKVVAMASVERRDKHSLDTAFYRRDLKKGIRRWKWRVVTSFEEQNQSSPCAASKPHNDGGYGNCTDFTDWKRHKL